MSVGTSVFYSSAAIYWGFLSSFIYCECKHMLAQVGSEAITQVVSSDCAGGQRPPDT